MRILGIDYGAARVGVALGDTETGIASPLLVLEERHREALCDRLVMLAKEEGITLIVVGIPHPLADQTRTTPQAQTIRDVMEALRERGIRVEEADETLSTQLAQRQAKERGQGKKRDDLAASVILQSWLDKRRYSEHGLSS